MTWLIHRLPPDTPELELRTRLQRAELEYLTTSRAAAAAFAESYVGLEGL